MRLTRSVLAALVVIAPSTAVAQETVTMQARAAIADGRSVQAIALLERHLADHPRDTDAMRILAGAYAAERRYTEALDIIDRAGRLAPADLDIRLARARILLWAGQLRAARSEAAAIAAIRPDYPDLADLQHAIATAGRGDQRAGLSYSQAVSAVDTGGRNQTWWDSIIAGYASLSRATTLSGDVEREDRAGVVDTRFSLRLDSAVSPTLAIHASVAATAHPDFRELYSIGGGLEAKVSPATTLLLDARHSVYRDTATTAIEPAVQVRLAPPVAVTVRWINLVDSAGTYRTGGAARIDYALPRDRTVFAGTAVYPDTEAGITRRMWSIYAGASLPVSDRLRLRIDAACDRRADSYTQRTLAIGLVWRLAPGTR